MTNTIDVARELMRLYDGIDADNCGVNFYRMIRRMIQERFPGITSGEYERAHHVMMAQMEMFLEDASMRIERMKALFPAVLQENLAGNLTGPFHDAFNMAFAECDAMGKMTAENVFPTKPDKSKS
jgi:hypothetical protein